MSKLPYIAFYPGDWRKDVGVQSLSYHHRGVWLELLMLMHTSENRGRLVLAGQPMSVQSIARLLGMTEREAKLAIDELIASGVASCELDGTVYNRRMVREEERRSKLRQNASKGGSKTQANREATPYQAPDIDIENESDSARGKVREFARGEGLGEKDADWFFDKCEGNGWTNGGEPIRDWKATVRAWKKCGTIFPSHRQRNGNSSHPFTKPKERAPIYPKLPPSREITDEELAKQQKIVRQAIDELQKKFGTQ